MSLINPEDDLALLRRLGDSAREVALPFFRAAPDVLNKDADGFDPVTEADKLTEQRLRALISEVCPDDSILGEEQAPKVGISGRTWILDPIDGTRAFIAGLPSWCVLIALCDETGPILSLIDQPFTGERFIGIAGYGQQACWYERDGVERQIQVRGVDALPQAIGTTTDPYLFRGAEYSQFEAIRADARLIRYGLDAYGYAAMALGGIDFVVETGLSPWDHAALAPIVRGAGGVFTDWQGRDLVQDGRVIAAASPALHRALMDHLQ